MKSMAGEAVRKNKHTREPAGVVRKGAPCAFGRGFLGPHACTYISVQGRSIVQVPMEGTRASRVDGSIGMH